MGNSPTVAFLAALLIAGPAAAAGTTAMIPKPGVAPVDCLPIGPARESNVRDDRTIDFRVGRKIYRNTLPNSCPQLGTERRFTYATSLNRLCSLDIITVLTQAGPGLMRGASCGLGQFQEVVPAPH